MEYSVLAERDIDALVPLYIRYYNECEGGGWTPETVRGRLRPIVNREDSFGLVQTQDGETTGFACGYFEQFDDGKAYDLAEIVVWKEHQNRGFGTALLAELEKRAKTMGAFLQHFQKRLICSRGFRLSAGGGQTKHNFSQSFMELL